MSHKTDRLLAETLAGQTKLLEAIVAGEKATPASIGTAPLLFGAGGLWTVPGTEPDVITAHVRPHGFLSELDRFPSVLEQPRFASITGFTATSGAEAVNPCDDNPQGYMKGCYLTAQFGRLARDTQTIEFDKVMLRLHSGITTDLTLRGRLLGLPEVNPAGLSESDVLNIVTMAEMVGVGVQMERTLSTHLWQGSPANNTAGGGYKEFPGLANQIATGQVDADTGNACPALDSDVKDFNYNDVCGASPSIVEYLSMLEFYLRYNAVRMGLDPVEWKLVMRPELWFELSACWPCQYNTNKCANSVVGTASRVFIDGRENVAERDRMRQDQTIDINGHSFDVVTDTGIFEHTNVNNQNVAAGQYASSIFFVPMTITGGYPVTYMEHVDYRRGASDLALLRGMEHFWTDRGIFSWAIENNKWCYKLSLKTEERVVLRTPQLAGRIDNILYSPLQHLRSPYPDSPYFQDGGASLRSTPSLNAVWL
jgi:hypothetical protein